MDNLNANEILTQENENLSTETTTEQVGEALEALVPAANESTSLTVTTTRTIGKTVAGTVVGVAITAATGAFVYCVDKKKKEKAAKPKKVKVEIFEADVDAFTEWMIARHPELKPEEETK